MNRRKFLELGGMGTVACGVVGSATGRLQAQMEEKGLTFDSVRSNKGSYIRGETVKVSFAVRNATVAPIEVRELWVRLMDITDSSATFRKQVAVTVNLTVPAGGYRVISDQEIWNIPSFALANAFGIQVVESQLNGSIGGKGIHSFFRVVDSSMLTTFSIKSSDYKGLRLHHLDGGMSAEYAVVKSLENLSPGVSNSWQPSTKGSGPSPVFATPSFLREAIDHTIACYDRELGAETEIETVILGTGAASVPYFSMALKAPVLPSQFLASCNSIKEVTGLLQAAREDGDDAFAVLGYDASMKPSVAWIKLLGLPEQYIQFLIRHRVKNLVLAGTVGPGAGEGTARKVNYQGAPSLENHPGDLFILYTEGGTSEDHRHLSARISDLDEYSDVTDSGYIQISDWESGLADEQVDNFANLAKSKAGIANVHLLTAARDGGTMAIYETATWLSLYFMKKNLGKFDAPSGVSLNPYLLSHPLLEARAKDIPFLFWQGNSPNETIIRSITRLKLAVGKFFPEINFSEFSFRVNTSRNFGGFQGASLVRALHEAGFQRVAGGEASVDEIWNLEDGWNSPCELAVEGLFRGATSEEFRTWHKSLVPLTSAELSDLASMFPLMIYKEL
jgi:hypothetical protein